MPLIDAIFGKPKKKRIKEVSLEEGFNEGYITEEEFFRLKFLRADQELDEYLKKDKKKKTAKGF